MSTEHRPEQLEQVANTFSLVLSTLNRYGKETLSDVESKALKQCDELGFSLDAFQSNHEGALIDRIHAARMDGTSAIVINAGAYTHTSVALRDDLASIEKPFIEVYVSLESKCRRGGSAN